MGNAEQTPLAGDVVFAAEQKLPKPPTLVLFAFEQTAPALAALWHPRLTKAGNGSHVI